MFYSTQHLLGVYTFSVKQSSSPQNTVKLNVVCKHFGPKSVAFSTPCHGSAFCGAFKFISFSNANHKLFGALYLPEIAMGRLGVWHTEYLEMNDMVADLTVLF